jgi:alpha-L-fucosidase
MMSFTKDAASLHTHGIPAWFKNAKLGIFIHWGVYSVPGWAPSVGQEIFRDVGTQAWFRQNPYAEWYWNSMRIPDSPTHQHHLATYGEDFSYQDFGTVFNIESQRFDPTAWAELFKRVGVRYVVLTAKHHDGFTLWPSEIPNPNLEHWTAKRDIVGDLTDAVRAAGLRMGLYYSGGPDWTFSQRPILDVVDLLATIPQSEAYVQYVDGHWRELIARYQPDVMWNDIGMPIGLDVAKLMADYYNVYPDGVVNDRFSQIDLRGIDSRPLVRWFFSKLLALLMRHMDKIALPVGVHADFRTPEYGKYRKIKPETWEATRGIGLSFGYNQNERSGDLLSLSALITTFVDIVSKNGNLLLNVGPRADGSLPESQLSRLLALGRWLEINGPAIFETHPWQRSEGWCRTEKGRLPVRFTARGDDVFAIVCGPIRGDEIQFENLSPAEDARISLLGKAGAPLSWRQAGRWLVVHLPSSLIDQSAVAFRMTSF